MSARPIPAVTEVNLLVAKNCTEHHTDKYEATQGDAPKLVLRRGQQFNIDIAFDQNFDAERDFLILLFYTSSRPSASRGTEITIPVWRSKSENRRRWNAWLETDGGGKVAVAVYASPDCVIGIWNMQVLVMRKEDGGSRRPEVTRHVVKDIYILFNPWIEEDMVYLGDESLREEYVMNDIGKIWRGTSTFFRPTVWNYGQFEDKILDACMTLLERSRLSYSHRGSAIQISRTISAMVNANDDNGVLIGNWSGDYSAGTAPTDWQGSVQILDQWASSGRPVMFGQCWVFAGVANTVLRALGIPARVVTNFNSAHDTDTTVTSDVHIDEKGNRLDDLNTDSIWNFHVWNEGWMARADLSKDRVYDGWQVLDATPQEKSEGVFRVGPAPVAAIKLGEVGLQYDSAFVFAEVNADKILWVHREGVDQAEAAKIDTTTIGKFISTKRPGALKPANQDREDLTSIYKPREFSAEEREAVLNALNNSNSEARYAYNLRNPEILECKVAVPEGGTNIGENFTVSAKLKNLTVTEETAQVTIQVESTYYNGTIHQMIKSSANTVTVPVGEDVEVSMEVSAAEYLGKLVDQASVMVAALVTMEGTEEVHRVEESYRVQLPEITIEVEDSLEVGKETNVVCFFTNPLDNDLTGGKFIIEGPGIEKPIEIQPGDIGGKSEARVNTTVTPKHKGSKVLLVSFSSDQLKDLDGSLAVDVL